MSDNKFIKYLNISLWVMFAISLILVFLVVKDSDNNAQLDSSLNTNFYWAYLLFLIAFAGIVLFSLYQFITIKGDTKKTIIAFSSLAVIFIVSYLMSSSEIPQFYGTNALIADGTLTPGSAQMTDTGLYATYILAFISVATLVYTSVSKIWSK